MTTKGSDKVNERPIIFNTEMVKATLEGRKTQSRRVIKPQPLKYLPEYDRDGAFMCAYETDYGSDTPLLTPCPYGQVGGKLWVRETWAADISGCERGLSYRSDHADPLGDGPAYPMRWRPSIHMPRWASRISLEIVKLRVERVQFMSDYDAQCEGVHTGVLGFAGLWDSLNPKHPWEANPWVWVLEFRRRQEGQSV